MGLRYCGIGLIFMRYLGNSNVNVRYHLALRYAVFHHFG